MSVIRTFKPHARSKFLRDLSDDLDTLREIKVNRTTRVPSPVEVDYRQSIRRRIDLWNAMYAAHLRLPYPAW